MVRSGLLLLALLARHPIHSSVATVTLEPGSRVATVTLRVFAEDFPPGQDSTSVVRYLAQRFLLTDGTGRRLPLAFQEARAEGAVLILVLRAEVPEGLSGGRARVWHGVLAERYPDQVNLVQVRIGARTGTLIFTAGDGPKPLR